MWLPPSCALAFFRNVTLCYEIKLQSFSKPGHLLQIGRYMLRSKAHDRKILPTTASRLLLLCAVDTVGSKSLESYTWSFYALICLQDCLFPISSIQHTNFCVEIDFCFISVWSHCIILVCRPTERKKGRHVTKLLCTVCLFMFAYIVCT